MAAGVGRLRPREDSTTSPHAQQEQAPVAGALGVDVLRLLLSYSRLTFEETKAQKVHITCLQSQAREW